jgi:hypothetical protein
VATFLLVTIILARLMTLADALMRGLLGMRSKAVVEYRIVAPADALPIRVILPAPIATGNHSLRAFSVLLADGWVMWPSNAICWPQQFASNVI